jgi:hypothetical protein
VPQQPNSLQHWVPQQCGRLFGQHSTPTSVPSCSGSCAIGRVPTEKHSERRRPGGQHRRPSRLAAPSGHRHEPRTQRLGGSQHTPPQNPNSLGQHEGFQSSDTTSPSGRLSGGAPTRTQPLWIRPSQQMPLIPLSGWATLAVQGSAKSPWHVSTQTPGLLPQKNRHDGARQQYCRSVNSRHTRRSAPHGRRTAPAAGARLAVTPGSTATASEDATTRSARLRRIGSESARARSSSRLAPLTMPDPRSGACAARLALATGKPPYFGERLGGAGGAWTASW